MSPTVRALCDSWVHPLLGRLSSRVIMSAMTRNFAGPGHAATEAMAAYYARRATHGVGLILTESTVIHPSADGFPAAPHLNSVAQVASWRLVTDAIHAAGGRVFCQLIHCGRISHPDYLEGKQPVSSTDQPAEGIYRHNGKPYGTPRRLASTEIPGIYGMFRRAAAAALEAGFDGVELHLAHGYLCDQFFDARVNDRDDAYGGSVENNCRFALELTRAIVADCGVERVMVRISPSRWRNGLLDWPDLDAMLGYLIPALDDAGLRLLDVSCAKADYFETSGRVIRQIRPSWPHFLTGGASLSAREAQAELDAGLLDMVTYGRLLIANPDLVERLREDRPIAPYDAELLESLT